MKIKLDEEPKKTRPCTFKDAPVGGVFKDASGRVVLKIGPTLAYRLEEPRARVDYEHNTGDPVTYYPDATLHMGRAVTEVEV